MTINLPGERWNPDNINALLGSPRDSRLIFFDVDLTLIGYLLDDNYDVRPGAVETIVSLHEAGWEVALWSAGGAVHAQNAADLMGINSYISGAHSKVDYPMTLASVVEKFKRTPVAMFDDEETVEGILSIVNEAYEGEGVKRMRAEGLLD